MKRIFLSSMSLTNFKGHKSLTVDFSDETNIFGNNATGKSSIFDGFLWCLFGKDQFERKDYEIIPTVDGKRLDKVDSEVILVMTVDNIPVYLRRVLHQKWVRRKGKSNEVFDGCDTLYYINDVPKKAGEYKAYVDSILDESVFKLVTNNTAFLSLHWTKQREILFLMAGTISDLEVLDRIATVQNKQEVMNLTNILNSGKSLADFKKELAARKKKLNEDLADIQPKIDQTTKLMPEQIDVAEYQKQVRDIEFQIAGIERQIADKSEAIRGQYEGIQAKQKQINTLKTDQLVIVNAESTKVQQEAFEANQKRQDVENELRAAKRNVDNTDRDIESTNLQIGRIEAKILGKDNELENLRTEWKEEAAKEYTEKSGCLICPVFGNECKDEYAQSYHVKDIKQAKKAFFEAKEKKLAHITSIGLAHTEELEGFKKTLVDLKNDHANSMKSREAFLKEYESLKEKIQGIPPAQAKQIVVTDLPGWQEIQTRIKAIEATIKEVEPVDNTELNNVKSGLISQRDQLLKKLSSNDLISSYKLEVKTLEAKADDLAQQIADVERTEFTIADFTKSRVNECEGRINRMFEIVRFQLFDTTNDGNEFECCIATNKKGVPIAATNTAEKINAGLDIIRTLSSFYNASAPIFCDGAESVNNHLRTGSQMVFLKVTKDEKLIIC